MEHRHLLHKLSLARESTEGSMKHELGDITLWQADPETLRTDYVYMYFAPAGKKLNLVYDHVSLGLMATGGSHTAHSPIFCTSFRLRND